MLLFILAATLRNMLFTPSLYTYEIFAVLMLPLHTFYVTRREDGSGRS